ncbi:MAG: hypothetical protein IKH04_04965 [Kiritimatiellae bacterium]|nr:hypothetical protein [Kiritimatiellia bacterium]
MRDIELNLEYDENVDGENKDIFKCSDKVKLTAVKIEVRKIWFNYKQDSAIDDALNIRMAYDENLPLPEYVRDMSNYPVAYIRNTVAKIKVSFSIAPSSISSAKIYGLSDDDNGSLGDALERSVAFASGVSQSTSPTGGNSEFVEFELAGQTPSTVFKSVDSWTWGFSEVDGLNVSSLGLVSDHTSGHVIYTLWDYPKAPWTQTANSSQNPWVSALSFAIETAGCSGKNDFNSMKEITQYLHSGHGLTYDTTSGSPLYYTATAAAVFSLSEYIGKTSGSVVNCYDQASGVVSLATALGLEAYFLYMTPFGYINSLNLVGVGLCNNPFYMSNGTSPNVDPDLILPLRVPFGNHAFALCNGIIFDACAGPCLGESLELYLAEAIDVSTSPEAAHAGDVEDICIVPLVYLR